MKKVILYPSQQVVEVPGAQPLLKELSNLGINIHSTCGGFGTCTDCKVKVLRGADQVDPLSFEEIKALGNVFHITKERLSCQFRVLGEVVVDISQHTSTASDDGLDSKVVSVEKRNQSVAKTKIRRGANISERPSPSFSGEGIAYRQNNKKGGNYRPKVPKNKKSSR
jgi:ferredoxin, 2Fe-2S